MHPDQNGTRSYGSITQSKSFVNTHEVFSQYTIDNLKSTEWITLKEYASQNLLSRTFFGNLKLRLKKRARDRLKKPVENSSGLCDNSATQKLRRKYISILLFIGLWTNPAPISEMICAIKCIKALAFSRFLVS